jgi:NHL repeat
MGCRALLGPRGGLRCASGADGGASDSQQRATPRPPGHAVRAARPGHRRHRQPARGGHGQQAHSPGQPERSAAPSRRWRGRTAGRFSEPVGLAVGGPDASVYVADTWNKRIQKLDRNLEPVAQWAVPGWEGRGVINKPYVVVDKRDVIYASDPERSRILRFDAQGRLGCRHHAWRSRSQRGQRTGGDSDRFGERRLARG